MENKKTTLRSTVQFELRRGTVHVQQQNVVGKNVGPTSHVAIRILNRKHVYNLGGGNRAVISKLYTLVGSDQCLF